MARLERARESLGGWRAVAVILAVWTVLLATYAIGRGHVWRSPDAWERLLYALLAYLLGVAVSCLYLPCRAWLLQGGRWRRIGRFLVLSAGLTLGHSVLDTALEGVVFAQAPDWLATTASNFAFYGSVHLAAGGLVMLLAVVEARQDAEHARALLEASRARAEFSALQLQTQPHFLFNALNGAASLVTAARGNDAVALLGNLSALLRMTMKTDALARTTLQAEFAMAQAYAQVQVTRFADRLTIDWDVELQVLGRSSPALFLTPMLDEAVRWGLGVSGPAHVRVGIADAAGRTRIQCLAQASEPRSAALEVDPIVGPQERQGPWANLERRWSSDGFLVYTELDHAAAVDARVEGALR